MNRKTLIAGLCLLPFIAACAPGPNAVAPTSVPPQIYNGLTCEQVNTELAKSSAEVAALSNRQKNAATVDALGVFFVLLPVSSLIGNDVQGDLAQAKGEKISLESAARSCGVGTPRTYLN